MLSVDSIVCYLFASLLAILGSIPVFLYTFCVQIILNTFFALSKKRIRGAQIIKIGLI